MIVNNDIHKCFVNELYRRTRKGNSKGRFKYFLPKEWYELFDYCIIYKPRNEIEFYTLNIDYKEIWTELRQSKYGESRLIECGFDDNYHCYIITVQAPQLLRFLKSMHDTLNPIREQTFRGMAERNGYSRDEINQGWVDYKYRAEESFERHFGKHIKLREGMMSNGGNESIRRGDI